MEFFFEQQTGQVHYIQAPSQKTTISREVQYYQSFFFYNAMKLVLKDFES